MRNYYEVFVSKKSGNATGSEPTKPTKGASVGFVGSVPDEYSEIFASGALSDGSDGPGTDTFEERVAIMMYDGGLTEEEALRYLSEERGG